MTIGGHAIGAHAGHPLPPRRIPLSAAAPRSSAAAPPRAGLLGQNVCGSRGLQLRHRDPPGLRRLRLRRGNGADRIAGRPARRAAQPPAVPGGHRLLRPADDRQQRRDPGLGRLHHGKGRRLVQGHRHRQERRPEAVQRHRRLRAPRRLRVPAGHHRGPAARGSRRRGRQGGADRRRHRALRPGQRVWPHDRLRGHLHRRLDHRLRPAARHAGGRAQLPGVLRRGILRAVHPLPRRQPEAAGRGGNAGARVLQRGLPARAVPLGETMQLASKCGLGQSSPNAFLVHRQAFPRRDPGPHAAG